MIDREACWKRSEVLCLPQTLTVGCQKSVFNIGLENQEIRITLDIFTGMNISCALDVFLTLSSLAVLVSEPLCHYLLFSFSLLSLSYFVSGLQSGFLRQSISSSVSYWELTQL